METEQTTPGIWAAGKAHLQPGIFRGDFKQYRVGYTRFVGGRPMSGCVIRFFARKPGPALASIGASDHSPTEFHLLWFHGDTGMWLKGPDDAVGSHGRCDACGAPCDDQGCTTDRTHEVAHV